MPEHIDAAVASLSATAEAAKKGASKEAVSGAGGFGGRGVDQERGGRTGGACCMHTVTQPLHSATSFALQAQAIDSAVAATKKRAQQLKASASKRGADASASLDALTAELESAAGKVAGAAASGSLQASVAGLKGGCWLAAGGCGWSSGWGKAHRLRWCCC